MAIHIPPLPQGTRVRVLQRNLPQDPALVGRLGTVIIASEYQPHEVGVQLDGEAMVRVFTPAELEITEAVPLPPERIAARGRRSLP